MRILASQEGTDAKEVSHTEPFPDADIRIGTFVISGVRTFSIILLLVATYCYLALKMPGEAGLNSLHELVLMAVGFLFGAKVLTKK